jgi:hypothetical protein
MFLSTSPRYVYSSRIYFEARHHTLLAGLSHLKLIAFQFVLLYFWPYL